MGAFDGCVRWARSMGASAAFPTSVLNLAPHPAEKLRAVRERAPALSTGRESPPGGSAQTRTQQPLGARQRPSTGARGAAALPMRLRKAARGRGRGRLRARDAQLAPATSGVAGLTRPPSVPSRRWHLGLGLPRAGRNALGPRASAHAVPSAWLPTPPSSTHGLAPSAASQPSPRSCQHPAGRAADT